MNPTHILKALGWGTQYQFPDNSYLIQYSTGWFSVGHLLSNVDVCFPIEPGCYDTKSQIEYILPSEYHERLREIPCSPNELIRDAPEDECGVGQCLLECHPDVVRVFIDAYRINLKTCDCYQCTSS